MPSPARPANRPDELRHRSRAGQRIFSSPLLSDGNRFGLTAFNNGSKEKRSVQEHLENPNHGLDSEEVHASKGISLSSVAR